MRVGWVSKRPPLRAQMKAIRDAYPDAEIIQIGRIFQSPAEVILALREARCDAAIVNLPKSYIVRLLELDPDIELIYPVMRVVHKNRCNGNCPEFDEERDAILKAGPIITHVRFSHFERIKDIELIGEPL